MFGYVKIVEDELRVKELRRYRAYYCGLCKHIAVYSQVSRIMLSYDMVFFALLFELDVSGELITKKRRSLIRCRKCANQKTLLYVAALSIALQVHKLENDVNDGDRKKRLPLRMVRGAYEKVKIDYLPVIAMLEENVQTLYQLESEKCANLEQLEIAFASSFRDIVNSAPFPVEDVEIKSLLAYHMAAWLYWFDMIIDLEEDRRSGDFNAILLGSYEHATYEKVLELLFMHMYKAERASELLSYNENTAIIQNIVKLGVPMQMKENNLLVLKELL